MKACQFVDPGTIELYFYGELDASAAARVNGHLTQCSTCRQHVEDLRSIRAALASRPRVDAPASGDWSEFTRRLDAAVGANGAGGGRPSFVPWLAIAATLTIAASGVVLTSRLHHNVRTQPVASSAAGVRTTRPPDGRPAPAGAQERSATVADRSLVEHSEEHFERSKLVVLGLATLDPQHARPADWQHERQLATSLLPDTRLYRLAAEERGMTNLARVLGDLETVLVETSMSERADPDELQRVQHLIARRDLVVKMNVVGSGI